jgi:hypothetical protein
MSTGLAHDIVKWHYDSRQDVLYVTYGIGAPSYAEDVVGVDGMHVERDLSTNEVTGVVIVDFSKQDITLLSKHMPFKFDFAVVR